MKRYSFLFSLLTALTLIVPDNLAFAQEMSADSAPVVELWAGLTSMPYVNWKFKDIISGDTNKYLSYDMDTTAFSSYEANFSLPKIGIAAGVFVNVDDTVIGRVNNILGYLGYKNLTLRVSKGRLKGTASWDGPMATGMEPSFDFDYTMTNIDCIYYLDLEIGGENTTDDLIVMQKAFYVGLGYTEFTAPVEIKSLLTPGGLSNQYYGDFVYDKNYNIKTYDLLFGFDTLSATLRSKNSGMLFGYGFGIWALAQDRIGFGFATLSKDAAAWAEAVNPGKTIVDRKTFVTYLENNTSIGLMYVPPFLNNKVALAVGYNLTFASLTSFEAAAEDNTDLGYDSNFSFYHHGIIIRLYAVW